MNKGRPPKGDGEFPFSDFDDYQTNNAKEEPVVEDVKPENVEFVPESNPEPQNDPLPEHEQAEPPPVNENGPEPEKNNIFYADDVTEKVYITLTEKDLIICDAVVSGFLESVFNFVGFKKDVSVINQEEARILKKIMPDIEVEKSWKNFLIAYLTIKIIK